MSDLDFRTVEEDLRARVRTTMTALREEIVSVLTHGEMHLRAVPELRHDVAGWYGVAQASELAARGYAIPAGELAFPVPAQCPWWHEAEVDSRDGGRFRFFARHAWLALPFKGRGRLTVVVVHALSGEARDGLRLSIDGVEIATVRTIDRHDRLVLRAAARLRPASVLRLECSVSGVPSELHPGSTDSRLLSVAIAPPAWHPFTARCITCARRRAWPRRRIYR